MTQTVDAIYTDGVLKPTRELSLKDNQRVRLTVETIDDPSRDRQAAIGRLKAGIESMREPRWRADGKELFYLSIRHPPMANASS